MLTKINWKRGETVYIHVHVHCQGICTPSPKVQLIGRWKMYNNWIHGYLWILYEIQSLFLEKCSNCWIWGKFCAVSRFLFQLCIFPYLCIWFLIRTASWEAVRIKKPWLAKMLSLLYDTCIEKNKSSPPPHQRFTLGLGLDRQKKIRFYAQIYTASSRVWK